MSNLKKLCLLHFLEPSVYLTKSLLLENEREWWVHPINAKRNSCGEFHLLFPDLKQDEERFQSYFRMLPQTFYAILDLIIQDLQKQETNYRKPVSPEERLALTLRQKVVDYFKDWFPGGQVKYTPCGLAWRDKWGSARYASGTAFIALVAAEKGINPDSYRTWAVEQINYILGDNKQYGGCFSFQVGYGSKYPKQPHHRAASCPSKPSPCSENEYKTNTSNPHVIVGALVGGPDVNGKYEDIRSDYVRNEVALDYNAGFQGSLAAIVHLQGKGQMTNTNNKCKCKE